MERSYRTNSNYKPTLVTDAGVQLGGQATPQGGAEVSHPIRYRGFSCHCAFLLGFHY